ncbi:putative uncharacterized protein [Firmicutes bacterium CAG:631]|nr:putative uncharacterized protein [Firmicutes bacterium CAG:631]
MKKLLTIILTIMLITMTSCDKSNSSSIQPTTDDPSTTITTPTDDNPTTTTEEVVETANMTLTLKIGNTLVDLFWLDNESVKDLKKHAKDGLTIELHQYGDFEQTGSLGFALVSNDSNMSVGPGEVVLYNSNQICLYYDNNSWSFTKLGHINLSKSELRELLAEEDAVTITLGLK